MFEFIPKGNVMDEDFMIHIKNDLPEDYDVILDGLKNHLTSVGLDILTIKIICGQN